MTNDTARDRYGMAAMTGTRLRIGVNRKVAL